MKKLVMVLIVIALVGGAIWYVNNQKQSDGIATSGSGFSDSQSAKPLALTQFVPSDTAFFTGGRMTESLVNFIQDYPVIPFSASDRVAFYQLKSALAEDDAPEMKFFNFLIDDLMQHVDGSYQQVIEHYGLATSGEFAIYMHGMMPVFNIPVSSPEKLVGLLNEASSNSGLTYQTTNVGDAEVMTWPLKDTNYQLHLATTAARVVISISSTEDDAKILQERLAQASVEDPITEVLSDINQKYAYTNDMVSVLQLDKLFSGLLKADDSRLAKDIVKYIPEQAYNSIVPPEGELRACEADLISLISAAPRMLMGYHQLALEGDVLKAKIHSIWEVNNPQVNQAMQQMQGYIPAHVLTFNDQVMSGGWAFDVAQITPAITTIWQSFMDAKYTCKTLTQAQADMQSVSPMMLGMMTGMAQGLKGIGFSLFDVSVDDAAMSINLDAALTIEADNPANLLSLLQMLPEFSSIQIPNDGSEVSLPQFEPYGLDMKAVMSDKHIVLFTGDKGKQVRETVVSEPLQTNAFGMGGVLNYKKLADLVLDNNLIGMVGEGEDMCIETYASLEKMQELDADISYLTQASDNGFVMLMDMVMPKPEKKPVSHKFAGDWKVSYLNETCQWVPVGQETLNADNTGLYVEQDESAVCELYKSDYQWQQNGQQLIMSETEFSQSRDSCEEKWNVAEMKETLFCELMYVEEDSFMCLYHNLETEPFLYRYAK